MQNQVRHRQHPSRALDVTVEEGTILVQRTTYGVTDESRERVRVPVFVTAPARVRVTGSVTRNLGDYNSARVEVSVEMPCHPEESEIRATYEWASRLLDELIPAELEKAVGGTGEASNDNQ